MNIPKHLSAADWYGLFLCVIITPISLCIYLICIITLFVPFLFLHCFNPRFKDKKIPIADRNYCGWILFSGFIFILIFPTVILALLYGILIWIFNALMSFPFLILNSSNFSSTAQILEVCQRISVYLFPRNLNHLDILPSGV